MKSEKELQLTIEGTSRLNQNDWISKNNQIHTQIEFWKGS